MHVSVLLQVINEIVRLANIILGIFKKAKTYVHIKGILLPNSNHITLHYYDYKLLCLHCNVIYDVVVVDGWKLN